MPSEAPFVLRVGLNLGINSVPQAHYTTGTAERGAENFPCLPLLLLLSKGLNERG